MTVAAVDYTDGLPTPPSEAMAVAVGQMLPLGLLVLTLLASAAGVSSRSGRAAEMTDTCWHSNAEMAAGHTLGMAQEFDQPMNARIMGRWALWNSRCTLCLQCCS